MLVDLHTHTRPASDCSTISHVEYYESCVSRGVRAIALTNHGDMGDNRALEQRFADSHIVLLHGVEISTLYGDFIVFSPDLEYLDTFDDVQAVPRRADIPDTAAVVWVHPAAGGGRSGSSYYPGLAETVAPLVDAVEVYNGTWLQARYVDAARSIADEFGLSATGGSDAHRVEQLGACATEVPGDVNSTADLVTALRQRSVAPVVVRQPRSSRLGRLFGR
jgi:predicted metal-dependent phosphoesterase TrpH